MRACGVAVRAGERASDALMTTVLIQLRAPFCAPYSHGPPDHQTAVPPPVRHDDVVRGGGEGVKESAVDDSSKDICDTRVHQCCEMANQGSEAFREAITGPLRSTGLGSLSYPESFSVVLALT